MRAGWAMYVVAVVAAIAVPKEFIRLNRKQK